MAISEKMRVVLLYLFGIAGVSFMAVTSALYVVGGSVQQSVKESVQESVKEELVQFEESATKSQHQKQRINQLESYIRRNNLAVPKPAAAVSSPTPTPTSIRTTIPVPVPSLSTPPVPIPTSSLPVPVPVPTPTCIDVTPIMPSPLCIPETP